MASWVLSTGRPLVQRPLPARSSGLNGSTQSICNDSRIQSIFDPSAKNYHHYYCETDLIQNDKCSAHDAYNVMLTNSRFIAPVAWFKRSAPVTDCLKSTLTGFIHYNPIKTVRDDSKNQITNYTLPNHILYPGKITRKIFERDGMIYVGTEGEGTCPRPWREFNLIAGPVIFKHYVDQLLKTAVLMQFDFTGLILNTMVQPEIR